MRRSLLMAILVVAVGGAGCATPPPYNPFKITRDEIFAKVKIIALSPVLVPGNLEDTEPVRAKVESLIAAKLKESGFTVVESRETQGIWKQMSEQMGGLFDPLTGKRDVAKSKAAREFTLREIRTKFNADALLHPSIRVVTAQFAGGRATWDKVSEPMGISEDFWKLVLDPSITQTRGTVSALSLIVVIEDMNGVDMYVDGGGIQLLAKMSRGNFVPVPPQDLFAKEERIVGAVNFAMDALVTKPAPAGAAQAAQ